jgi:hypothetical protein
MNMALVCPSKSKGKTDECRNNSLHLTMMIMYTVKHYSESFPARTVLCITYSHHATSSVSIVIRLWSERAGLDSRQEE